MPGGDGTGPLGLGPMTGRRAGFCAGYAYPGYANPIPGRGRGLGFGRGFGRGGGRGWRNRYYATGLPGWARANYGWDYPPNALNDPYTTEVSPQDELNALKNQAELLKQEMEAIQKQISELEKLEKKGE